MLTNFFSKTKPSTIIVVLLLFICYYGFTLLSKPIDSSNFIVLPLFLLMLTLITFIDIKNNLSFNNTYVLLFYTVLIAIFPTSLKIGSSFYANFMLLLFLRKIYSLQSNKQIFKKTFDASFWLGVSFLFEPFVALFFIMLYLAITIHKQVSIQVIIITFIGFCTPLFLFFTYWFYFDNLEPFYNLFYWYSLYDISLYYNTTYILSFSFISLLLIISIISKTPKTLAVSNNFRRSWILVLIHFFSALFLVFITNKKDGSELLYLFFPVAIIMANGIELFENKWYVDIVTILCLLFPVILLFF